MGMFDRLQHAWNAFLGRDPTRSTFTPYGSYIRPDRTKLQVTNERSIVASIFNRIAVDCAAISFEHVRLDENKRYIETLDTGINDCLTTSANLDQTGRAFIQDIVMSLLDEGCIAVVPVDTTISPMNTGSYDILSMRVGKIVQWYPKSIRVSLYREETGRKEEIVVPKSIAAIIENPFYSVMNEPNSTLQRLIRKLNMLDVADEQTTSGKLDMIIQLPYVIKSDKRKAEAMKRRGEIEDQLAGSKYGIAYIDGTEKITQLNRAVENNLLSQVQYLTSLLFSQLYISTTILDGTANEQTMTNYYNGCIEPIVSAITDEMKRKFLTKHARTKGQSIRFVRDPFRLIPINQIADIADKFTRNEILSSNEVRDIIGRRPSDDPRAERLLNKNMPDPNGEGIIDPSMADPSMMSMNAQNQGEFVEDTPLVDLTDL